MKIFIRFRLPNILSYQETYGKPLSMNFPTHIRLFLSNKGKSFVEKKYFGTPNWPAIQYIINLKTRHLNESCEHYWGPLLLARLLCQNQRNAEIQFAEII